MGERTRIQFSGDIQGYDVVSRAIFISNSTAKFHNSHKFLSGNSNRPDTSLSTVDVVKPKFQSSRILDSQSMHAIWLGHACYYVEFPTGLRVLFDPVFEDRCSPFSRFGHKRFTPKPCDISDIPIIDCVRINYALRDYLRLIIH